MQLGDDEDNRYTVDTDEGEDEPRTAVAEAMQEATPPGDLPAGTVRPEGSLPEQPSKSNRSKKASQRGKGKVRPRPAWIGKQKEAVPAESAQPSGSRSANALPDLSSLPTQIADLESRLTPKPALTVDFTDDDFDETINQITIASNPSMLLYVEMQITYIDSHSDAVGNPDYPDRNASKQLSTRKEELVRWQALYKAAQDASGLEGGMGDISISEPAVDQWMRDADVDMGTDAFAGTSQKTSQIQGV